MMRKRRQLLREISLFGKSHDITVFYRFRYMNASQIGYAKPFQ